MYCTNCGTQTSDTDNFCRECGHETPVRREARRQNSPGYDVPRRLYRRSSDRKIGGVCSGLAQYFEIDVTLVRLLVAAGTICSGGLGLLAYIVAWIIMPLDSRISPLRTPASAPTQTA
jgi:phage shock protein PspC (stress-responsive transcriptional regulator)